MLTLLPFCSLTLSDPLITVTRLIFGPYLIDVFPPAFERWVVNILPWPKLHELRDMADIMWNTAQDIVDAAKRGVQDEGVASNRPDNGNNIMKILSTFIFILYR